MVPVSTLATGDHSSKRFRAVAVTAGVLALAPLAAGIGLCIAGSRSADRGAANGLWLFGAAVALCLVAAVAATLARIGNALFELELDHVQRGLFRGAGTPTEFARRLTTCAAALGLSEFNDPPIHGGAIKARPTAAPGSTAEDASEHAVAD